MTLRDQLRRLPVFDRPLPGFDPGQAPDDPVSLFAAWLGEAIDASVIEPHVMTLSTADADGRPDARALILKDVTDGGWQFATSAASAKGLQLDKNPQAAASFYWREQGRQVRLRGPVTIADEATRVTDFLARSDASRIASLTGQQSAVLSDPADLARAMEASRQRLAADPGAIAADHTVYILTPDEVEFWQGDQRRQHVRLRYRRSDGGWVTERLWP